MSDRIAVRNVRKCEKDCLCLYVCPTGASDTENSVINAEKCVGCGACADACPKSIIKMLPETQMIMPACSSRDKGARVMKICEAGCIGCMKCQRECPSGAIVVKDNLAEVEIDKCVQCGHCSDVCPRHIIPYFGKNRRLEKEA